MRRAAQSASRRRTPRPVRTLAGVAEARRGPAALIAAPFCDEICVISEEKFAVPKISEKFRPEMRRKMRRTAQAASRRRTARLVRTLAGVAEARRGPAALIAAQFCVIPNKKYCGAENFRKISGPAARNSVFACKSAVLRLSHARSSYRAVHSSHIWASFRCTAPHELSA